MPVNWSDLINGDKYGATRLVHKGQVIKDFHEFNGNEQLTKLTYNIDPTKNGLFDTDYLIELNDRAKQGLPLGKELYVFIDGDYKSFINGKRFVNIFYVYICGWNGTIAWHPFDVEYVCVRVDITDSTNFKFDGLYGSEHGNGQWHLNYKYDVRGYLTKTTDSVIMHNSTHPIVYSAYLSHGFSHQIGTMKRFFGFGNNNFNAGKLWQPSKLIIIDTKYNNNTDYVLEIDMQTQIMNARLYPGIYYRGFVGGTSRNQPWIAYFDWTANTLDGYYKYYGGIVNIFKGKYKLVPEAILPAILIFWSVISVILLIYFIYHYHILNFKSVANGFKSVGKLILLLTLLVLYLLITFFAGIKIMVV